MGEVTVSPEVRYVILGLADLRKLKAGINVLDVKTEKKRVFPAPVDGSSGSDEKVGVWRAKT